MSSTLYLFFTAIILVIGCIITPLTVITLNYKYYISLKKEYNESHLTPLNKIVNNRCMVAFSILISNISYVLVLIFIMFFRTKNGADSLFQDALLSKSYFFISLILALTSFISCVLAHKFIKKSIQNNFDNEIEGKSEEVKIKEYGKNLEKVLLCQTIALIGLAICVLILIL